MPALHGFERKVRAALQRLGIGPGGMVVAVSGGPDSVALLRALARLHRGGGLVIAHLNHQLRGAESDADEDFVRQLPNRLEAEGLAHVAIQCQSVDVADQAKRRKANLEAAARRIRYDWLARVALEVGAQWVATGHTTDDQAETVLHRLLRGTGLRGLRGIAARRQLSDSVELVRPLLGLRRAEVLDYLDAVGQPYRIDTSNRDPRFMRNRIRHELLPLLAGRFNEGIVSVLGRLAEQASAAYQAQEQQARALLAAAERPRAGCVLVFDRMQLAAAPRHLVREFFRVVWEREGWPVGRMGYDAWDRLAGVASADVAGVDLPGGIRVLGRERVIVIERPD